VQVAKFQSGEPPATRHSADILFNFVLQGTMTLHGERQPTVDISRGDAFVIPPGMATRYANCSTDLELLEVALPGVFETSIDTGPSDRGSSVASRPS
jgi:mannose-6-phosphate isomerase-like protein (cupin superfamily)